MIFRVYMKDPDCLYEGINESLDEQLKDMPKDEAEAVREIRYDKAADVAGKWFEYGEYLMVEIDTDKETARVVPKGESND
jgi:hypothetical protein